MKLLKRVVKIQAQRAKGAGTGAVGIIWSSAETIRERVEGAAFDVHAEPGGEGAIWRGVWRKARDARDLGDVYDLAGHVMGRVVSVRGSLVKLEYERAGGAGDASA